MTLLPSVSKCRKSLSPTIFTDDDDTSVKFVETRQNQNNVHNRDSCKDEYTNICAHDAKDQSENVITSNVSHILQLDRQRPQSATACDSVLAADISTTSCRRRATNSSIDEENEIGIVTVFQQKLFENYHTVAYSIVISTYFIVLCEYIYLRLITIVFPKQITYYKQCRKHANETTVRNEINFTSTIILFILIGIFQLTCFFLLTVSKKWLEIRRTFSNFVNIKERLRQELSFSIRRVMFTTIFATFFVYTLCSAVVVCTIFYMIGIRDAVDMSSQILIYFFDGCVIVYVSAFPTVCIIFHSDVRYNKTGKLRSSSALPHRHTPEAILNTTTSIQQKEYSSNSNSEKCETNRPCQSVRTLTTALQHQNRQCNSEKI